MVTILVADDYLATLRMLFQYLQGVNREIILALNSEDILARLEDTKFDLAIIDTSLPQVDSKNIFQKIREHPQHQNVPIILMVERSRKSIKSAAELSEANGFLIKPVCSWDLRAEIERVLALP